MLCLARDCTSGPPNTYGRQFLPRFGSWYYFMSLLYIHQNVFFFAPPPCRLSIGETFSDRTKSDCLTNFGDRILDYVLRWRI